MKCLKENNSIPHTIFLYDDPSSKTLNLKEIRNYLKSQLGHVDIRIRKEFITFHVNSKKREEYAENFARCKVRNINSNRSDFKPLLGEIRFEKKLIENPEKKLTGILYEGILLDQIFLGLIPKKELDFTFLHIVFTNRLFGTFEENDGRYHARVIICGYPSIISTTGIVEAPAKPKDYYSLKQKYSMVNIEVPTEILKEKFYGRFIDYNDPNLTEVMKGYVMQAVFYHIINEPFCENKDCRLYNAHWQEEVIHAQIDGSLCKKHKKILKKHYSSHI